MGRRLALAAAAVDDVDDTRKAVLDRIARIQWFSMPRRLMISEIELLHVVAPEGAYVSGYAFDSANRLITLDVLFPNGRTQSTTFPLATELMAYGFAE